MYTDRFGLYPGESYVNYAGNAIIAAGAYAGGAIGAVGDFAGNYNDMRNANTIGADKYFHCKANCEAAKRDQGGEDAAQCISDIRESFDQNIKGDSAASSAADQVANQFGRTQGASNSGKSCTQICSPFKPNGLAPIY